MTPNSINLPQYPIVLLRLLIYMLLGASLSGCCSQDKADALRTKLYSASARERSQAASSLAYCGSKAESAVPRLAQLLYDENAGVQSMAAYALRKIDTPRARAIMKRTDESRRR